MKKGMVIEWVHCSFCGIENNKVEFMLRGATALICNECVVAAGERLAKQRKQKPDAPSKPDERGE